jgi:hypothetical protein
MKRTLSAAIVAATLVVYPACAQFDFRGIGTHTMTYQVFKNAPTLPSVSKLGETLIVMDPLCNCLKISMNGTAFQTLVQTPGAGGTVLSVFGRGGAVVANFGDYTGAQVQATPFNTIAGTNVQTQLQQIDARITASAITTVFGRAGAVAGLAGDYTAVKITSTASGSIGSTDVQAAIAEIASEKLDGTVANTYTALQTYNSPTAAVRIKPSSAPGANAKLFELRSNLDASLAWWDAEGDETVNSSYLTSGSIDTLTALTLKTAGVTRATINSTGATFAGVLAAPQAVFNYTNGGAVIGTTIVVTNALGSNGIGVDSTATATGAIGLKGTATNTSGIGVSGTCSAAANCIGVRAETTSTNVNATAITAAAARGTTVFAQANDALNTKSTIVARDFGQAADTKMIDAQSSGGTSVGWIDREGDAGFKTITITATAFASLGTPTNGSIYYCNDCTIANPCAGSGTGALAKRLNGVWVCN